MKWIELNNEITTRGEDGFFQLEKDKEAIKEFEGHIDEKIVKFNSIEEKVKWLVDNNYYYNVYEKYTEEEIVKIFNIAYKQGFKFESFMAISKFYNDYAMQTNDKKNYLERYEDRLSIMALYLGDGNYHKAKRFVKSFIRQCVQPATPTTLNAGKARRGEMVSCFLLTVGDSLNDINHALSTAMQLSKIGGGVALSLTRLRGRGESIKGVEGAAKGIMPVMKLMEDAFSYADQMGQRKGSGAAYYNIFGWDVEEFLDCKKINADEKSRMATLSTGLDVPDKFFQLMKNNDDLYVFAPHSVYKEYGIYFDDIDMTKMYDELVANPNVRKRKVMKSREFWIKIGAVQMESGYPYLYYSGNANKAHPLKNIGTIKLTNLCTEIFQLSEYSEIGDYEEDDKIMRDINCNLASINIANSMEGKTVEEDIAVGMQVLTAVSDMSHVRNAPSVAKANRELHAVGLGVMNLHGYLAKNKIAYESPEAIEFVRAFFMMFNFYSIKESMNIAKDKNETFLDFEKSEYATGEYFKMYETEDFMPHSEKIIALFDGINLPTIADWIELKHDVRVHGLYHAYRLAIAPTQSISYIQNSTSSVMPIVEPIEIRTYANSTTYYPMPYMNKENFFYYKSAYNMDQFKVIDLISEIQRHIDQGISTILHVNSDVSTRYLGRLYIHAWVRDLKSLYYTRTNMLEMDECVSCAI